MQITFGNHIIDLQVTPIYGASVGLIYFDPQLEEEEEVAEEDMYYKVQILFGLFCLHITWWRWM